jgi:hypothetical protein
VSKRRHAGHIGGMEDIYAAYQVAHTIYGDTSTTGQFKEFMLSLQIKVNSLKTLLMLTAAFPFDMRHGASPVNTPTISLNYSA